MSQFKSGNPLRRIFYELERIVITINFILNSYTNPVWLVLDKRTSSILDIGCGKGEPMELINKRRKFFRVGVDIFMPCVRMCKRRRIHDDYVIADIRLLPFRDKSFDIALCLQVIEHISRDEGFRLIKNMERIARVQVIITTPIGFLPRESVNGNTYEAHISGWILEDFKKFGYKVRKFGFKKFFGHGGIVHLKPYTLISKLIFALVPFLTIIEWFIPNLCDYYLMAIKSISDEHA